MQSASLRQHFKNAGLPALVFLGTSFLLRTTLFFWSTGSTSPIQVGKAFAIGLLYDLSVLIYLSIPWMLLGVALPPATNDQACAARYGRLMATALAVFVAVGTIALVGEVVFWNEFHSRFNFIAVDYLVYTNEVLKNIWESYPVGWTLSGILVLSVAGSTHAAKWLPTRPQSGWRLADRSTLLLALMVAAGANYLWFPSDLSDRIESHPLQEVSKNGLYALFTAYRHNEINFDHFYLTRDLEAAFSHVRADLKAEGSLDPDPLAIARTIQSHGVFKKYNVVLVSMESMSARFMNTFGSTRGLTPNLDRLMKEGLAFTNIFATGTRTVRGLEALVLSIPPTPGQSILRRPHNENLYNLGSYFADAGYTTEFLYGGYGYFDNMNGFFSANSFGIWDQARMDPHEIQFKNAWGVCDEDLFNQAVKRADAAFSEGRRFFLTVMTTSNHRPYTYPQKIDIPSGSGREGAVKYADFAIGEFLRAAEMKPWFKNTLFVFVADHDAAVAGNLDVPIADFRIPLVFYAPAFLGRETISRMGSQIDVAPTILGLLNARYKSHFFGRNLMTAKTERAFFGTYQKVGLLRDNVLTLLGPNKTVDQFSVGPGDSETPLSTPRQDLVDETVSYYQVASHLFRSGKLKNDGDKIDNVPQDF